MSLQYTLFHWTLHPWAIYAVLGLALAFSTFRKGGGNRLSAAFQPLLGTRTDGSAGKLVDLMAVFATVFGSATSLGLGALQVAAGLGIVADVPDSRLLELIIIAGLTGAFVASAFSGLHRGIKWLSTVNAGRPAPIRLCWSVPPARRYSCLMGAAGSAAGRLGAWYAGG